MPFFGVPTLRSLCVSLLVEFRDCLEDIGDTPLGLVTPVLLQCNADQLASIEDGTREGGRDLHEDLQLHWQRNFISDFGWANQQLVYTSHSSDIKLAPRDWRCLYEAASDAHRQKAADLGGRLRAMTQAEQKSKQTRHVEVIAPTRAFAKHKVARQSSRAKASDQVVPARQRILSKLGLSHNKSLKQLVRIRPARALQPQPGRQLKGHKHSLAVQTHKSRSGNAVTHAGNPHLSASTSAGRGLHGSLQQLKNLTPSDARQDTVNMQEVALPQTSTLQHSEPQTGLIEADIDWRPAAADTQSLNGHAQPDVDSSWTVQFLEQTFQQQDRCSLPGSKGDKVDTQISGNMHGDKDPDIHNSFSLIEDDIAW